jgi:hypothetical protein
MPLPRATRSIEQRASEANRIWSVALMTPELTTASLASDRVRQTDGGVLVSHGERWVAVHSLRNPLREAEGLVAEALDGRESDLLVVIGLGLGYILDALEARGWTGRVLAIEPEPQLVTHLHGRRDISGWLNSDRVQILTAPDFAGAAESWRWFDANGEQPPLIVNAALERIRPEATESARQLAARLRFNAKANADARRKHGGHYLLNTLRNMAALAREGDVAALADAASGVPAIVVAAGPSLDANIDGLRDVGHRALVIAVDTALRPLLAAGIIPDLVVGLDPGEANTRHLWDLPPCPGTHLVAEASLDPSAIDSFRGRTFLFSVGDHQPWPWLTQHGAGRGRLRAWGSVLTSAFDLALQMGCDPIAFAGADLAFTEHRPYARNVAYEEDWQRAAAWGVPCEQQWRKQVDAWPFTEEPDIHGVPTRTAPQLVAFRDWVVEQAGRTSPSVVNATGAGILHGGRVQQASLADFTSRLPRLRVSPAEIVRSCYTPLNHTGLMAAAAHLPQSEGEPLATWAQFADGLTRERLLQAVDFARHGAPPAIERQSDPAARPEPHFDSRWIGPLAASIPLLPMRLAPERMEPYGEGVRRFRFRTTTARLIGCVVRLPEGAVAEDGRPMRRAIRVKGLQPGEYFIRRDEVFIAASDGTDPRENGRSYSVLVPEAIAYVERLPLHDILANNV